MTNRTGTVLFTGKGGAGKTTAAAAFALRMASKGQPTRLASLDPAHNLGDVLQADLVSEPREIAPNLLVSEVDLGEALASRMEKTRALMERRYRYLTVAAMEPLIGLLGQAPGAEEQAAVDVLLDLREEASRAGEILVLDMPPSGQTLRMLLMPELVTHWCDALLKLRARILHRRGTLSHILKEESPFRDADETACPENPDRDPVTGLLKAQLARHQALAEDLKDQGRADIVLVTLPARISLMETRRLIKNLAGHGIAVRSLVLNRATETTPAPLDPDPGLRPEVTLPDLPTEPRGPEALAELGRLLEALTALGVARAGG